MLWCRTQSLRRVGLFFIILIFVVGWFVVHQLFFIGGVSRIALRIDFCFLLIVGRGFVLCRNIFCGVLFARRC
jgi:hypothetical protein